MGLRSALSRTYLLAYNAAQYGGWLYVAVQLGLLFVREGTAGLVRTHEVVGDWIIFLQKLALLEIVHSVLGISRSPAIATATQSFGRNFILFFCIAGPVPKVPQQQFGAIAALYFAWAFIEIIRYPFYMLSDLGVCPPFLEWLRYTAFIPLYPLGAGAEACILYRCLPAIKSLQRQGKVWKLVMPNIVNFEWDTYYYCWFHLIVAYLLAFPQMYLHMFAQRRRKLGRPAIEARAAAVAKKNQ